jgi:hypothetical protein
MIIFIMSFSSLIFAVLPVLRKNWSKIWYKSAAALASGNQGNRTNSWGL